MSQPIITLREIMLKNLLAMREMSAAHISNLRALNYAPEKIRNAEVHHDALVARIAEVEKS